MVTFYCTFCQNYRSNLGEKNGRGYSNGMGVFQSTIYINVVSIYSDEIVSIIDRFFDFSIPDKLNEFSEIIKKHINTKIYLKYKRQIQSILYTSVPLSPFFCRVSPGCEISFLTKETLYRKIWKLN